MFINSVNSHSKVSSLGGDATFFHAVLSVPTMAIILFEPSCNLQNLLQVKLFNMLMQGTSERDFQNCNAKETYWPKMGSWWNTCRIKGELNILNKKLSKFVRPVEVHCGHVENPKNEICEK